MKICAQEKYGAGPSLPTWHNRLAKVAICVMIASSVGMVIVSLWSYVRYVRYG